MKTSIITRTLSLTGAIIILGCLAGCKDMFINPLKDKDTGESVTMLIIDRNFIKTKFYVHLVDIDTGEDVASEPILIGFFGPDSVNLVSFTGEKKAYYTTSSAFIEVGYDPNVAISPEDPAEFWVVAMSNNYTSVPQECRYTTEGTKDLVIQLIKTGSGGPGLKSGFNEPFDLKFDGELKSPSLKFKLTPVTSRLRSFFGDTYFYGNTYITAAAGRVTASNIKDSILYTKYGFTASWLNMAGGINFIQTIWRDLGVPSNATICISVQNSNYQLCNSGLKIHVDGPAGGSGTFNYRINCNGITQKEGRITCEFASDQRIEPVYTDTRIGPYGSSIFSVTLSGDAQYDMSGGGNLENDPCGATATFTATPKSNLRTYKFITLYTCPDNLIGMALSIHGQFRKAGTSDAWTDFSFKGGVCELLMEQSLDYDFRVNIDGIYHEYTLPTDPARIEAALRNGQNTDFKIKTLSVTTSGLTVTVSSEVQFSAEVCELIK